MRDFTLLIPTYNRPEHLHSLLYFLKSKSPRLRALVLDSSDDKAPNELVVSPPEHIKYDPSIHPFDKFRLGVHLVTTEFCAFCADDDVVLLEGVEECIGALRTSSAVAARGHRFSFLWKPEEGSAIYFTNDRWIPPAILAPTPTERLGALFGAYQAATYAVYRTAQLRRFMDMATPLKSLLGRELLTTALAAVEGSMLVVPALVHGRSMGNSVVPYYEWHPMEYFLSNLDGLAQEYGIYRSVLQEAIAGHPENKLTSDEARRAIDLIHLRYLVRNAPEDALEFLVGRKATGAKPEGYLPPEIQKSVLMCSISDGHALMPDEERDALAERLGSYVRTRRSAQ